MEYFLAASITCNQLFYVLQRIEMNLNLSSYQKVAVGQILIQEVPQCRLSLNSNVKKFFNKS